VRLFSNWRNSRKAIGRWMWGILFHMPPSPTPLRRRSSLPCLCLLMIGTIFNAGCALLDKIEEQDKLNRAYENTEKAAAVFHRQMLSGEYAAAYNTARAGSSSAAEVGGFMTQVAYLYEHAGGCSPVFTLTKKYSQDFKDPYDPFGTYRIIDLLYTQKCANGDLLEHLTWRSGHLVDYSFGGTGKLNYR
jgi:hypothetical protein